MAILAIDQGTTSSRAIVYSDNLVALASAGQEFTQYFPRPGWVEHDPGEVWAGVAASARAALERAHAPELTAIGITNQRETTVIWDRRSGEPIHNAIVWQDRRTADTCARLHAEGHEDAVRAATGLLLDPYFSATKIAWLLDHVPDARTAAERGDLAFGTMDSFLIWRLTGGKAHVTDATNAARTMLYDIHQGRWSDELCALFRVPRALLPEVRDCAGSFGLTRPDLFGRPVPILGVAGDQQAAAIGQACFSPGMIKATYGTGCFALLNTGDEPVASRNRLLTTIAWQLEGKASYALEGAIFTAGAVVQWLRDGLHLIRSAEESAGLAAAADPAQEVLLVPAFTGLGAPWWQPNARGAVFGLTRATGPAELARAALDSVAFQTRDLIEAMRSDWPGLDRSVLRIDGGMTASEPAMQAIADILGDSVECPADAETTARGAAWLAALGAGIVTGPEQAAADWRCARRFTPRMAAGIRERRYRHWRRAVEAVIAVAAD